MVRKPLSENENTNTGALELTPGALGKP